MEESGYEIQLSGDSRDYGFEKAGPLTLHEEPPESGFYKLVGRVRNTGDDVRKSDIHIRLLHILGVSLGRPISKTTNGMDFKIEPVDKGAIEGAPDGELVWKSDTVCVITTTPQQLPYFDPAHRRNTTCHITRRALRLTRKGC